MWFLSIYGRGQEISDTIESTSSKTANCYHNWILVKTAQNCVYSEEITHVRIHSPSQGNDKPRSRPINPCNMHNYKVSIELDFQVGNLARMIWYHLLLNNVYALSKHWLNNSRELRIKNTFLNKMQNLNATDKLIGRYRNIASIRLWRTKSHHSIRFQSNFDNMKGSWEDSTIVKVVPV